MKVYENYPADAYVEYCSTVAKRQGLMVPIDTIRKLVVSSKLSTGFCTVYAFQTEDALQIKESKSSKGLNRFAVGAGFVPIDIDTGDEGLAKCEAILNASGYEYYVYNSGGKGYHVYIPQEQFIWDINLPYSHYKFLTTLGVDADESLYQHGRLLALEGRVHHKTKRKKSLTKHVIGKKAVIEIAEPPISVFKVVDMDESKIDFALVKAATLVKCEPSTGMRHTRIWSIAKDLMACGMSQEAVIEIALLINDTWSNKKDEAEIRAAVKRAYDQFGEKR